MRLLAHFSQGTISARMMRLKMIEKSDAEAEAEEEELAFLGEDEELELTLKVPLELFSRLTKRNGRGREQLEPTLEMPYTPKQSSRSIKALWPSCRPGVGGLHCWARTP